jgi:siroheme synthase-like protein
MNRDNDEVRPAEAGRAAGQPAQPRYLTLAIDVSGRRCLVVGGGRVGARKATTLAGAGAVVIVVAPEISEPLGELAASGRVEWRQDEYDPAMLSGFTLVVAATDDPALNLRIAADAERRGILSCNVSAGHCSRTIFPAIYADGEVAVAVHTHGRSCRRSQEVRNEIAAFLSSGVRGQAHSSALNGLKNEPVPGL